MTPIPTRTCLVCRRAADQPELVRFAVRDGAVAVDRRAAGRGAYVCHRQECLEGALRRQGAALLRALRVAPGEVTVEEDQLLEDWRETA